MKILVTGGTGFVGSHTVVALRDAGHDVRLLVRDPDKLERVPALSGVSLDEVITGDVTDTESVQGALEGVDGVVHTAAVVALDESSADLVRRTNVGGTETVIGGAHDAGVERIVYVSSASVFGVGHDMVSVETPVARAAGAYAESKAAAEHYVRARQAQGAPVAITYPSGVLGPDSPQYTVTHQGVGLWLKVALLTPTGIAIVDVRDLARAHVRALERGGAGRYMIGGHYSTWTDWATVLRGLTGRRVLRLHVPGAVLRGFGRVVDRVERLRQGDLPLTLEAMEIATQNQPADSRAAVDALEITFRPLEETLADTITWMAAAGHVTAKQAGALAP